MENIIKELFPEVTDKKEIDDLIINALKLYRRVIDSESRNETKKLIDSTAESIEKRMSDNFKIELSNFFRTSSRKGKMGERILLEILKSKFPTIGIEDVSGTPHSADILLDSTILLESKNYSKTVPSKEIEKFMRDMSESKVTFGIFVSFGVGITGHHRFSIDKFTDPIHNNEVKFIVYVPYATEELIESAVLMTLELKKFMKTPNEEKKYDHKIENLEHIISICNKSMGITMKNIEGILINELNVIKNYTLSLEKNISGMYNNIAISMTEMIKHYNL
jgi:nucleoid DNA-binding protein